MATAARQQFAIRYFGRGTPLRGWQLPRGRSKIPTRVIQGQQMLLSAAIRKQATLDEEFGQQGAD